MEKSCQSEEYQSSRNQGEENSFQLAGIVADATGGLSSPPLLQLANILSSNATNKRDRVVN